MIILIFLIREDEGCEIDLVRNPSVQQFLWNCKGGMPVSTLKAGQGGLESADNVYEALILDNMNFVKIYLTFYFVKC